MARDPNVPRRLNETKSISRSSVETRVSSLQNSEIDGEWITRGPCQKWP